MMPLSKWRQKAQYFNANGHQVAYWTHHSPHPDNPWLLLIHGYPTSTWDWTAMWPKLEKSFNIAALDMLGFGLSDKPTRISYTIALQADLQEALLALLGVSEAHLFVHDYGVTVAQELLARQEEASLSFLIKSVCFLNGGLFPEQHRPRPIQKLGVSPFGFLLRYMINRQRFGQSFQEIFGQNTKPSNEELDSHWALIREKRGTRIQSRLLQYIPQRTLYRDRWVGALTKTMTPLRLINGGADPVSGKHLYDAYLDTIPNADAFLLETLGHYPHTEAPDQVLEVFEEFHERINQQKSASAHIPGRHQS